MGARIGSALTERWALSTRRRGIPARPWRHWLPRRAGIGRVAVAGVRNTRVDRSPRSRLGVSHGGVRRMGGTGGRCAWPGRGIALLWVRSARWRAATRLRRSWVRPACRWHAAARLAGSVLWVRSTRRWHAAVRLVGSVLRGRSARRWRAPTMLRRSLLRMRSGGGWHAAAGTTLRMGCACWSRALARPVRACRSVARLPACGNAGPGVVPHGLSVGARPATWRRGARRTRTGAVCGIPNRGRAGHARHVLRAGSRRRWCALARWAGIRGRRHRVAGPACGGWRERATHLPL